MPLIPVTRKLAPSSNPYAFRTASAQTESLTRNDGSVIDLFRVTYDAIWLGRKNGVTTVTIGSYSVYADGQEELSRDDDLTALLAKADTRYGGSWAAKYDGETLLVEPTHPLTPQEQMKLIEQLSGVLQDPESLPPQWIGWFKKVAS